MNEKKEFEEKIKRLESNLKDEKNKCNILLNKIELLEKENSQLKNKINSYNKQQNIKNDLLNDIKQLKNQTIQSHNHFLNSLNNLENTINISNGNINSNDSFLKLNKDKENIINDLNKKLKRFPFILEKNEKLISVIFSSFDEKINYSVICKNTDNIHKIEDELYKEYPNLFENQNIIFLYKGKIINRYQTLESNHIKNGDTIILNYK